MDAFFGEADERGRTPAFSKIAVAAIVGNEDGAHHVTAELLQGLNDVGWTIPATAACYWVGEAMHKIDFNQLGSVPEPVANLSSGVAASAAHLANYLKSNPYPGRASQR